ncbi:MAG: hypothetical protein P4L46_12520 [Fimbriimonas sp.]|nr:hypothetical protein [Fimbriimonas sp.]
MITFILAPTLMCGMTTLTLQATPSQDARQSALAIAQSAYSTSLVKLTGTQKFNLKEAIGAVSIYRKSDPVGHFTGCFLQALSQNTSNDVLTALAAWEVEQFPLSAPLLNNLGYALFLKKDYPHSIQILNLSIKADAKQAEYFTNLGNAYLDSDQDELSSQAFNKAIALDPNHETAWLGLAAYCMKNHKVKQAMDILGRHKPMSIVRTSQRKVQDELDAVPEGEKCDWVLEEDEVAAMAEKVSKIADVKPLSLAPVVETISKDLANEIRDSTEKIPVTIAAPMDPFLIDFSDSQSHTITMKAYSSVQPIPMETPYLTPEQEKMAKMSQGDRKALSGKYRQIGKDLQAKIKALKDSKDPQALQKIMDLVKNMPDPDHLITKPKYEFKGWQTTGDTANAKATPSVMDAATAADSDGMVTTSNYVNHAKNQINFKMYVDKLRSILTQHQVDTGKQFDDEMADVLRRQAEERDNKQGDNEQLLKQQRKTRNALRDNFIHRYGDWMKQYYSMYVKPALEKIETADALFIKGINNPEVKKREAKAMRTQLDALLSDYSVSAAPVGDYEPDSDQAAKQLQEKIDALKAQVKPKKGEATKKLAEWDDREKSLLTWIYKDAKASVSLGVLKVEYKNNELTMGLSDVLHKEYMAIGVNLVDSTVSLTEAKGVDFNVAVGVKSESGVGASGTLGITELGQGTKTTLHYDDSFNVDDAKVETTKAVDSLTGSVKVGDSDNTGLGVKGTVTASIAEGFSSLKGATEMSYEKGLVAAKAETTPDGSSASASLGIDNKTVSAKGQAGLSKDANGDYYVEAAVESTFSTEAKLRDKTKGQKAKAKLFSNSYKVKINQ